MTDREFKKLNRAELIEIIFQLQNNEKKYQEELAAARMELDSKHLKIAEAGSIAEAVVGLSGIFKKAQAMADQYLEEVHAANADAEGRARKIIDDAQERADKLIADAQRQSDMLKEKTERETAEKWEAVNAKIVALLQVHSELSSLLGK